MQSTAQNIDLHIFFTPYMGLSTVLSTLSTEIVKSFVKIMHTV